MKKIILSIFIIAILTIPAMADQLLTVKDLNKMDITANAPMTVTQLKQTSEILKKVHKTCEEKIKEGYGPFYAVIIDEKGNIISETANSVVKDNCSSNHAEMNAIREAQKKLGTYDLAPYNLSIYVNAEPCIMCTGAIMWSGIKTVYYSVPSKSVEIITGFDEGFKTNWLKEFKKRGINVYGNIIPESGEVVLQGYTNSGKKIYKPTR